MLAINPAVGYRYCVRGYFLSFRASPPPTQYHLNTGIMCVNNLPSMPHFPPRRLYGATENARHENTGRLKMQGWKMRDMKMRDQFARVENAGKVSMESQSVKKVSQSSCICVQSYSFSISLLDK